MRAEIEHAFRIDACDIYGLSEVMGPGVAQEFVTTKDGPTIWEDHFLPEIVNPRTGERVADGEEGELVFTSLTKETDLLVIRYRTRDQPGCCREALTAMRRMAKIVGRTDDMLIIRGVNVFPSQIEEMILGCAGLAPHYEIEITRPNRLDEIRIVVEARAELGSTAKDAEATMLAAKAKGISSASPRRFTSQPPGSLPRSAGKASHVRDRR